MNRLTFVDEDGQVLFDNPAGFPEDIGFTIRELSENEEWETLDNIAQRLANCEQRLKYYENLEEQGKLPKLPVALGDTAYRINKGAKEPIIPMKVCEIGVISLKVGGFVMQIMCRDELGNGETHYLSADFGKTVFLTRPEAERALEEMEGKK